MKKYNITHADGRPVNPDNEYFVLRLNEDDTHGIASRLALMAYLEFADKEIRNEVCKERGIETSVIHATLMLTSFMRMGSVGKGVLEQLLYKIQETGKVSFAEWILICSYGVNLDTQNCDR